jgi:hypothetical protein
MVQPMVAPLEKCVQAQGMYFEGDHTVADEYIKWILFGTSLITLLSDLVYQDTTLDKDPLSKLTHWPICFPYSLAKLFYRKT